MKNLVFKFNAREQDGWPLIKVWLDGVLEFETWVLENQWEFCINKDLAPGPHTLIIERGNSNNLKNWEEGYVSEQELAIVGIWYEDVELPQSFLLHGQWYFIDHQGQEQCLQNIKWRSNGRWVWQFESPVLDWIINKVQRNQDLKTLLNDFQTI